MTPTKQSIKEFFAGKKQYFIPAYQRAYSWEQKQLEQFLEDLKEASKGENNYFFGNVLLEKNNELIDGQQRITTIIIFARVIYVLLKNKNEASFSNEKIEDIKDDFLIHKNKAKLESVAYDRDYFKDFIILDEKKHEPCSPSQKRIKDAREYFTKELEKEDAKELERLLKTMCEAEITSMHFENKKDSVLMFELQNNRGKALSDIEKLKSYLCYQLYTYTQNEEAELKIKEITSVFEEIYRLMNDIKTNEDFILEYFNISLYGYYYKEGDYKEEIKKIGENSEKIKYIEAYVRKLKNAFVIFKDFENLKCENAVNLRYLDLATLYPFVLKAYDLFGKESKDLENAFHLLEIIAFRHKLVKTGTDLINNDKLDHVLKNFKDIKSLEDGLRNICNEHDWNWGKHVVEIALNDIYNIFDDKDMVKYIFERYENKLRKAKTSGYKFSLKDIKDPDIERIAPKIKNEEKLASGYWWYDEKFRDIIGNLLLISKTHNNSSIGNKPFSKKLESYDLLEQQKEIQEFANEDEEGKLKWDTDAIVKRHLHIVEFVLETWSFKDDEFLDDEFF
ncbi:DUF262 domain-containing protein [Campylobacter sp. MIT 99-7217]|uniref:DUF262 domain-containing protein n=1 Tax=Campylobacter sp. MIT 99-7217 TaxID=535091 RepID=UPI00115740F0|nr:DUF262 domain-containing protein [Campylobacter sp. MIT 99-7217]TQR33131.1 DUF262 domain-containing protein [Campylobacter sp. MIT 99-7217]